MGGDLPEQRGGLVKSDVGVGDDVDGVAAAQGEQCGEGQVVFRGGDVFTKPEPIALFDEPKLLLAIAVVAMEQRLDQMKLHVRP